MDRSRLKALAARGVACGLLTGTLLVGQAPVSHADHVGDGGCWSAGPSEPSGPVDYRGPDGPFLVGAAAQGTFVAVDGDASGIEVYGRLGTFELFSSKHWFRVTVDPTAGKGEEYLDVCSKPHG